MWKARPAWYSLSLCCWQGTPYDGVDLSVHVQLGHAPAGRVVGEADGDGLGAVGQRHRDLKQLQKARKSRKLIQIQLKLMLGTYKKPIINLSSDFFVVFQHSIILLSNYYVQNEYNGYDVTTHIFSVKRCYMPACLTTTFNIWEENVQRTHFSRGDDFKLAAFLKNPKWNFQKVLWKTEE